MIEKASFGRTGHESTRTLFGGAALWKPTQEQADEVLATLLKYGVNHIDTAASYGESERWIGPWMKEHRDRFFLATKTEQRTYDGAWEELERSLQLLQTDWVDLWQMHLLVEPADWETAMGPGGALEAFSEAREQGLTRFLGVTGHGVEAPAMHLKSLQRFDFDSVLLPYNYPMTKNAQYMTDFEALLALCKERNAAVQTIKGITRRPWGDQEKTHSPWYQPLTEKADIARAVHWILGRPGVFLNTVADTTLLPLVLEAAAGFEERPSDEEMEAAHEALGMAPLFT